VRFCQLDRSGQWSVIGFRSRRRCGDLVIGTDEDAFRVQRRVAEEQRARRRWIERRWYPAIRHGVLSWERGPGVDDFNVPVVGTS